jgi:hypothetical protein
MAITGKDKIIRIFDFLTGKLIHRIDESIKVLKFSKSN